MSGPAAVTELYVPDPEAMRLHVEHLFGGWLPDCHEGRVELAWTETVPDAGGRYALSHAQLYGTDRLDELVEHAARLNAEDNCCVYVGASLRRADTPPFGRTGDVDAWALTAFYADLDDEGAIARAVAAYGAYKPTMVVVTGTFPFTRAQLWWRLKEPIIGGGWSPQIAAIAGAVGGDSTVQNLGRVMRLAGSVAWPHKPGRITEVTAIQKLRQPGPPEYLAEHLAKVFPVGAGAFSSSPAPDSASPAPERPAGRPAGLGIGPEKLSDGREGYMLKTVLAVLLEWIGTTGAVPTAEDLFDAVWPQYSRKVDFSRPGRGADEVMKKCRYTLQRFERGAIPTLRSIQAAREAWQKKQEKEAPKADPFEEPAKPPPAIPTVDFYTLLTEDVIEEPDYIEPAFAGPGNFILIAGPPKAQKSFLLQEMLVACATGGKFLTGIFDVPKPLKVFYLQAEMNRKLLRKRARVFKFLSPEQRELLKTNFISSERFHMILDADGVKVAVETIQSVFPDAPPDIIAVDPLANLFDGDNENDNSQLMRFLTQRLEKIRQKVNPLAVIVLVHHFTKKSSEDLARDPFVAIRGAGALRGYYDSAIAVFRKSEEGKVRCMHFELRGGESPEPIEATLVDGRFEKATEDAGLPSKQVCRLILAKIDAAWRENRPWSPYTQAKAENRYAQRNIVALFDVPLEAAKTLIEQWQQNKVITYRDLVKRVRPAGFEVTGSIDGQVE